MEVAASPPAIALIGGLAVVTLFRKRVMHASQYVRKRLTAFRQKVARDPVLSNEQQELLKGNDRLFNTNELRLLKMLLEEGQQHICAFWPPVGINDAQKKALTKQLMDADAICPQGLQAYIQSARRLLEDSKLERNPFEGCRASVPEGVTISAGATTGTFEQYERSGLQASKHCAFVLVAGGLGERLGYHGIKVSLPSETATGTCFLGLYIQSILALQRKSGARRLPLAIMTSDETHTATLDLLKKNKYFGASARQVTLIKQGKVPCFADHAGHLATDDVDPYKLLLKPHGHGDVHNLLHTSGLAKAWWQQGFKWVAFFQDTNALVFRGLVPSLGVSTEKSWHVNSMCVPRFAKEAIGGMCRLQQPNGRVMTISVEYNQLDALLKASGFLDEDKQHWKEHKQLKDAGDVNGPDGRSPFPGSINQIIIKLEPYVKQLDATRGVIAEFVNPKYKGLSRTVFQKPTRLECMMQDYPKTIPSKEPVGFTSFLEVGETYSPAKVGAAAARKAAELGAPTHSPTVAEFDIYRAHAKALERLGCFVEPRAAQQFNGLNVESSAQVVLAPSFAMSYSDLKVRMMSPAKVKISARSSLVFSGDITVEELDVDGALEVFAHPGTCVHIKRLIVRNAGWRLVRFSVVAEPDLSSMLRWVVPPMS